MNPECQHHLANELPPGRVEFHDKVDANKLIAHTSTADIGIVFADLVSAQFEISLPNKLFEYIMAGLMVVVGPGAEMEQLVNSHGLGLALGTNNPEVLAKALDQLTPERIEQYKKSALEAAQMLNWEREQQKLLQIYEALERSSL